MTRWKVGNVSRIGVSLVALLLVLTAFGQTESLLAQTAGRATLTVLRGSAAVLRADGTAISPATSGLVIGVGDQVSSLARSQALITFFDGTELELGSDTTLIVQEMATQGRRTTITVRSVFGTTLHRVVTLADPGSTYRVEAGGSVAIVRGTTFAHYHDPGTGDVTVAVSDSEVEFPSPGAILRRGERRTFTSRGDTRTDTFDPAAPLLNVVTNPVASSNPSGSLNPGLTVGNQLVSEQPDRTTLAEEDGPPKPAAPIGFFLTSSTAPGATTLQVTTTEGLGLGDTILINPGQGNAETAVIVGFGSVLVTPLRFSHAAGEPFVKLDKTPTIVPPATPTFTPTGTLTVTSTPTGTLTVTSTPTGTLSVTPTPTGTLTVTPTPTSTGTGTATPTPTATPPGPSSSVQVNSGADTNSRDGEMTLREAILVASGALAYGSLSPAEQALVTMSTIGADSNDAVVFAPSVTTVTLTSALPSLSGGSDTIDGGGLVTVQGGGGFDCLTVTSNTNTIRGLTIRGCTNGINVASGTGNTIGGTTVAARNVIGGNTGAGIVLASSSTTVIGNAIGTNAAGPAADANGTGISIAGANNVVGGTAGVTVGGPCTGSCNLISGNTQNGIAIVNAGATGNTVLGNFIGTDRNGSAAVANGQRGVYVDSAPSNVVGGTASGAGNVISGNTTNGIEVNAANGNQAVGNRVGTNAAGSAALANQLHGVQVRSSTNTTVGGAGAGNLISGHPNNGIDVTDSSSGTVIVANMVGTNLGGTAPIPNAVGIAVGNTVVGTQIGGTSTNQRNVVSGNTTAGISLFNGATGTVIQGNSIGTNVGGTAAVANNQGIIVGSSISGMTIGGTAAGAGNLISGNTLAGISVDGTSIQVLGNRIGTNAAGTAALPNVIGVGVTNANITVGDATGGGNVISGNTTGIDVTGASATNTQILGNRIGTSADGMSAIPNTFSVDIGSNAANTTIGGTTGVTPGGTCTGACNVIVGQFGIFAQSASTVTIIGNYVGTNVQGMTVLSGGGAGNGIDMRFVPNVTIGGSTAAHRNVIGGYTQCGINLQGTTTTNALVEGNYIGVGADNAASIPNFLGINVADVPGARIGGSGVGTGNVILNNNKGIWLNDGSTAGVVRGNEIGRSSAGNTTEGVRIGNGGTGGSHQVGGIGAGEANQIRFNGTSGIRVSSPHVGNVFRGNSIGGNVAEGITLDAGANNNVTPPTLVNVDNTPSANTLHLNLPTGGTVDVYVADALGQGITYRTSSGPHAAGPVDIPLGGLVTSGQSVVATVTDGGNNTSEFSNAVVVP